MKVGVHFLLLCLGDSCEHCIHVRGEDVCIIRMCSCAKECVEHK